MSERSSRAAPSLTLTGPVDRSPGLVSYSPTSLVVTFTPSTPLARPPRYTATLSGATDLAGNMMVGSTTWSFTTPGQARARAPLFSSTQRPGTADAGDPNAVELGHAVQPGHERLDHRRALLQVCGNTGVHTGASGRRRARCWPRPPSAASRRRAGRRSRSGRPCRSPPERRTSPRTTRRAATTPKTSGFFSQPDDNSPLHAPASTTSTPNGLYMYGQRSSRPSAVGRRTTGSIRCSDSATSPLGGRAQPTSSPGGDLVDPPPVPEPGRWRSAIEEPDRLPFAVIRRTEHTSLTRADSRMTTMGVAVVGAGTGDPTSSATSSRIPTGICAGSCDLDEERARAASPVVRPASGSPPTSTTCSTTPRSQAVAVATPAAHPHRGRAGLPRRGPSRPGREAAGPVAGRRPEAGRRWPSNAAWCSCATTPTATRRPC